MPGHRGCRRDPLRGIHGLPGTVRKARLAAGQAILIQGANGGVGGFAVQLARQAGARIVALAKPEHHDAVRKLGAEIVFDYRDADLVAKVRAETEGSYSIDIMLEVANPGDALKSLGFIHYNGQLLSIDPLPVMANVPPYTLHPCTRWRWAARISPVICRPSVISRRLAMS
ncbi:zinc-binding dehydrogenase [Mesorhizobium sp. M1005]|uniref:zinc-binding dehydrogenase n=1 Tax=unclassified Mesorhizobium TaxID=325217 RepID=UPI00333DEB9D